MSDHYDGRDHEYCEQCGDCVLCDNPHSCINQLIARAIIVEIGEPMKTSWKRLQAFSFFTQGFQANGQQVPGWLTLHPDETKFAYAIKRVNDQIKGIAEKIQTELDAIDIDKCATDSEGVILRDEQGNLRYTKDGLKAKIAARKAAVEREDIEIEPYFAVEVPDLKPDEREILLGFVIKEERLEAVA